MKYETASAFRQALDQRLKQESERTGLSLSRLRKQVVFELLLRRLVVVAPNRWVLKGALALNYRFGVRSRSTKDIDLGRVDSLEAAIEHITAAQQLDMGDYFTFAATRDSGFSIAGEPGTIRFRVTAELDGRTFEQFIVDIGLTDGANWDADRIETPAFLGFAGIEPIAVPTIPIAQHLAEKVHAYVSTYGSGGSRSTRPKDLVDILLVAGSERVDGHSFLQAIDAIFVTRDQDVKPTRLPEPPTSWTESYRALALEVGVEPNITKAFDAATRFVDPILGVRDGSRWDPKSWSWK